MNVAQKWLIKGLVLLLTAALLGGCGGKEERKAKYLERGKAFMEAENYDKARIEFKNVLQIDPKTAIAYVYTGEINEEAQNWAKAFANYKKAIELDPALIKPRVRLAQFYMAQATAQRAREDVDGAANALGLAKEQIDEVIKREPGNLEGKTLQATFWSDEGDKEKAIEQLKQVLGQDASLFLAVALLSNIYDQQDRAGDAEQVLSTALAASNDRIPLLLLQAQFYRKHEQLDKAEQALRLAIAEDPETISYRIALAAFLTKNKQLDLAEQVLREMIAADQEDVQRYIVLAEFLNRTRDRESAIAEMKKFIKQKTGMPELKFALVKLYIEDDKKDLAKEVLEVAISEHGSEPAARSARVALAQLIAAEDPTSPRISKLIKKVLADDPRNNGALMIQGRLAAQQKNYTEAINSFRTVLKDQPNSAEVLKLLATVHAANGEPELAKDTLNRAVEANPENMDLRFSLVAVLISEQDINSALKHIEEILSHDEFNQRALAVKYELLARKGDVDGVEAVARKMQAGEPEKEDGYLREARLRFAQKNYEAALEVLDKVLEMNSESNAALLAKSDVLAAQKDLDGAIAILDKMQLLSPDSAEAFYRKGVLLKQKSEFPAAIAQFELALEKSPNAIKVLTALTDTYIQSETTDEAVELLQGLLKANPDDPSANELIGIVYLARKELENAEKAFERQLEINPEGEVVYSQLAQTRLALDNLKGATQAYEQGLKILPDSVRLLVSLAGMREREKDFEGAIAIYEKVLEDQPGNAVSLNNLASLLSDHRDDEASLARAIEMSEMLENASQPAFVDTAGWARYRNGEYDRAVELLSGVVEKAPKVQVFQYHLGMAYFKQGNQDAARKHLTLATEGEPEDYQGLEEARATLKTL